jgi:hypothetical protein
MAGISTLIGIGELGCSEALAPPPTPGLVPTSTADGIIWLPVGAGGVPVVTITAAAGVLTVTVNGASATLTGVAVLDAFGTPLGYLWPV